LCHLLVSAFTNHLTAPGYVFEDTVKVYWLKRLLAFVRERERERENHGLLDYNIFERSIFYKNWMISVLHLVSIGFVQYYILDDSFQPMAIKMPL
jgi:hypothetical protein